MYYFQAKKTYKKKNKENHEDSGFRTKTRKTSRNHNHTYNLSINNSMNVSLNHTNRLITDYFQIRKSSRKCKSDIERERREHVENAIKMQLEEGKNYFALRNFCLKVNIAF